MNARSRWFLIALTALPIGCDSARTIERKNEAKAPTPTPTPTPTETPTETENETETETAAPSIEPAPIPSLPPADHRIWIPTTAGPLIIDVDLFIGDVPLSTAYDQWIKALLIDIGGDHETGPSWTNLIDIVGGDSDRFGQTRNAGSMDETQRRYDINRNGTVDIDEATKYIFQPSAAPSIFRVFGTDAYRYGNRENSALFAIVDANGDGSFSDDERDQASTIIRSRMDANADGNVTVPEVESATAPTSVGMRSGNSMLVGAWDRRKSHRRGDVAMDLTGFIDWSSLSYNLIADATTRAFGLNRRLFAELDVDRNGSINDDEASALRSVPADLRIEVRFSDDISLQNDAPEMRVVETSSALSGKVRRSENESQIVIADDSFQLVLRAASVTGGGMAECWRYQVRGRAAEAPDAWLAWLDVDHDQVLSAREMTAAPSRLPINGEPKSVPDAYVVQFGRGDPNSDELLFSMRRDLVSGGNGPSSDPDPRPTWAIAMDSNRDGDIARDEFLGTGEQFAKFDRNGDGFVDADEIVASGVPDNTPK